MNCFKNTVAKYALTFITVFWASFSLAQAPDKIYMNNIKTVKLYTGGDQLGFPVINLNSNDQAELHFDDLDADIKYYYYSLELYNADWTPTNVTPFDYLKGYTQVRINTYRNSSIAYQRYTHYSAIIPDRNSVPIKSGNYLLRVFLDGDTSNVAFTKRLMVLDNKAIVKAQVIQPFAPQYYRTHQKVQFSVNITGLNAFSANQQIKIVVLQNRRWDIPLTGLIPTFIRGNSLEYNTEDLAVFPAGKEFRWLDLRDFHLQTDRVKNVDYNKNSTEIYLKPDLDRSGLKYVYYSDLNGMYTIDNTTGLNPQWQNDYGLVHFTYQTPSGQPLANKDLYLIGEITGYNYSNEYKMHFDAEKGLYENAMLLKEGYYNYNYVAVDKDDPFKRSSLDGDYYETENEYTILVYYHPFAGRSDELIGVSRVNSRSTTPGFSF